MAVAEPSKNRRHIYAVAVGFALGLALAAVVVTVGKGSGEQSVQFDSLLNKAAADSARRASYQGNVGTVYVHLQHIIDKILWHKNAWEKKYKSDLTRVAKEVSAAVAAERAASKASDAEAGKAAAAAAKATRKKDAWTAKKAGLVAKKADAEKEKRMLKDLFDKGNAQKGGEIEMIKKIRCEMSKFNKDGKFKCDGPAPVAVSATRPVDKCEVWRAEEKANKDLKKSLKTQVKFNSGATTLTSTGKKILNGVAKVLKQFPWMKITVEGNSPASGAHGKRLTSGRAKTSAKYLKSLGCKNQFKETGKKSSLIGLKVFSTEDRPGSPKPAGC